MSIPSLTIQHTMSARRPDGVGLWVGRRGFLFGKIFSGSLPNRDLEQGYSTRQLGR
jgi:hypothetical protein